DRENHGADECRIFFVVPTTRSLGMIQQSFALDPFDQSYLANAVLPPVFAERRPSEEPEGGPSFPRPFESSPDPTRDVRRCGACLRVTMSIRLSSSLLY